MRLLTMPVDEKTRLVEDVLADLIKTTGEQVDADLVAITTGLVFGELMKKASSRSPACSTVEARLRQYLEYQEKLIDEPEVAGHVARCNLITAIKEILDPQLMFKDG